MNPENAKRLEFNSYVKEAEYRLELNHYQTNKQRKNGGLNEINFKEDVEKYNEELKEEVKKILKENQIETNLKKEIDESYKKREEEEDKKRMLIEQINFDKNEIWNEGREERIKNWRNFNKKLFLNNKKSPFETRLPGNIKPEEIKCISEKVKYRSLAEK